MKAVPAIVCSLMLAGTLFVPATRAAGNPDTARACCCDCGRPSCCAAKVPAEPPPVSAAPLPSTFQNQFLPAFDLLAWTLPETGADEVVTSFSSPLMAPGAPLYVRNCARLI